MKPMWDICNVSPNFFLGIGDFLRNNIDLEGDPAWDMIFLKEILHRK
jgi:hypothetical protein